MTTCPHGYTIHSITNTAPGCHKCEVDKLKYTIQAITEMNETWRVENEKLRNTIAAKEQTQSETEVECVKLHEENDRLNEVCEAMRADAKNHLADFGADEARDKAEIERLKGAIASALLRINKENWDSAIEALGDALAYPKTWEGGEG